MLLRSLALDVGDKRIGVAVSDALNMTAQAKGVIVREEHHQDLAQLKDYIEQYGVTEIVVGLPKNMDNTEGSQAKKTKNFANFLKNNLELPIIMWDERLTSRAAERMLIQADLSRKKRKKVIDQVAAALILQNYLDFKKQKSKQEVKLMSQVEGTFWFDEENEELVLQEDENEERFYVEDEINLENNRYLILVPSEEGKHDDHEALVMKLNETDDGEYLSVIEDDQEFEQVEQAYLEK